jgi:hypothetical protein
VEGNLAARVAKQIYEANRVAASETVGGMISERSGGVVRRRLFLVAVAQTFHGLYRIPDQLAQTHVMSNARWDSLVYNQYKLPY